MAINFHLIGQRIANARQKAGIPQEKLSEQLGMSRTHIAYIENGVRVPSIDTLIDIANALHVSADDLLVDSLDYSSSTADTKLHRLLLDCNKTEQDIIIRNAENLKTLLYSHSVK